MASRNLAATIDSATMIAAKVIVALALLVLAMLVGAQIGKPDAEAETAKAEPAVVAAKQIVDAPEVAPEPAIADQDELEAIATGYRIKSTLTINGPLGYGDAYWDESAAPATGKMLITVDLKAQTLSVFRNGHEIGVAVIMYGTDEKPTPTGVFPITQKSKDHVSNLYGAPMPYMLRMTNDGISVHGGDVEAGYGTHGCIAVPNEFARRLFEAVQLGDVVIVTDGEMMGVGDSVNGV